MPARRSPPARPPVLPSSRPPVLESAHGPELLKALASKCLLELKRHAAAHHAHGVHRIHQRFRVRFEDVAGGVGEDGQSATLSPFPADAAQTEPVAGACVVRCARAPVPDRPRSCSHQTCSVIHPAGDPKHPTDRAQLSFIDSPMISSLMFQYTRGGRQIVDMQRFELRESLPPDGERSLDDASPFIVDDAYGKLYARRRRSRDGAAARRRLRARAGARRGALIFAADARFANESAASLHHQRETQYYRGEWVTLSFRRELFDGFCGGCHGSVAGPETDIAVNPDILSSAPEFPAKRATGGARGHRVRRSAGASVSVSEPGA